MLQLSVRVVVLLFISAAVSSIANAQATWIVDRLMRPGYHYSDLPAAVAAAAPGDILFLRATTLRLDDADTYTGTVVQGKGITIVGEVGPGLPPVRVVGIWSLSGVPSGQTLLLRGLELDGSLSSARRLSFGFGASQCAGAVVFEDVVVLPHQQNPFVEVISGNRITDCSLVVFRHCNIDRGDIRWLFLRSKLMMSDTIFVQSHPLAAFMNGQLSDTMILDASQLYASASTIEGSRGVPGFNSDKYAIGLSARSTVTLSAGSTLIGGVSSVFGRTHWTVDYGHVLNPPQSSTLRYDPSAQLIGGPGQLGLIEIQETQTGLLTIESPGQVAIQQFTEPQAPTFLLMGPFQTTPWDYVIGPVFIDPNNVWSDLAVAPVSGILTRTFTIPPTIPIGQWVGAQAFSLDSTGRIVASNVTTVGVW